MTVRLDRERIGIPRTWRTAFASRRGRHVLGPHATVARAPTRHYAANTTTGQEKIGDLYTFPLMKMIMRRAELESVEALLTL